MFVTDGDADVVPQTRLGIRANLNNPRSIADTISQQNENFDICAVIAPDEKYGEAAVLVAELLGVIHNPISAVRNSANKKLSRNTLQSHGLPVPDFRLFQLDQDLRKQMLGVRFPCVAKPVNLSASRGVIRANNEKELNEALWRISALLENEVGLDQSNEILVERYVSGSEHALEGYLTQSNLETICIFDKPDPLVGPYFEESYYVTPSKLDLKTQKKIRKLVLQACHSFGLEVGPIHAEVRVEEDKIWILEVAARSIGGDCARLFELATNSTLEEFILRRSIHEKVENLRLDAAAGVLMIPVPANGILRRVEGVIQAQSVENILEVRLDVRSGDRLIQWPEGGKYPGYIFAKAQDPESVESSLRSAFSHLKFVCTPDLPVIVN